MVGLDHGDLWVVPSTPSGSGSGEPSAGAGGADGPARCKHILSTYLEDAFWGFIAQKSMLEFVSFFCPKLRCSFTKKWSGFIIVPVV